MKDLSDSRVLIVDDVKANVDLLVQTLGSDYKLSVALNGERALASALKNPPDIILLDIVMPGMDGYEVCRRLRAEPETRNVPVVFLSSLDDPGNKVTGFEAGATDYITKPFEALEVKARVRSLLKAKMYSDAVAEQMAGELRIARDIQYGILPSDFSVFCRGLPLELAGALDPAREVGGDLYTVVPLPDERLCVFIGDVSGKGIPAALFMAITTTLIRSVAKYLSTPEEILSRVNDELAADNPSNMFVTLLCLLVDCRTRTVCIANGGHTLPVLLRRGAPPRFLMEDPGTLLGMMEGAPVTTLKVELEPGDVIVTYTDGVTEALDVNGECFGDDRLLECLSPATQDSASAAMNAVLGAVRGFAAGAEQSDDIALLALRYAPQGKPEPSFEFPATAREVMCACEEIRRRCESAAVPPEAIYDLLVAFEEIASNVVNHGYAGQNGGRIRVLVECGAEAVRVQVRDDAPPFDPLAAAPPDLEDPDRPVGGLGIHIVRKLTDGLEYERSDGENRVTITRRRVRAAAP